ncbi:MAG: Npun_R2821/Npun_R2822 family protein [Cyanobacteriota bacterium]
MDGIYTLANDVVCNQLVALLNSIEVHAGCEMPVAVIAYDDRLAKVREAIAPRPQVMLLDDPALFAPWEEFSRQVWHTHPTAIATWRQKGIADVYRLTSNRRYAAFDARAPFDRFLYLDADTLLLNSPQLFFAALDRHSLVTYDFQHKDPSHIFNVSAAKLSEIFSPDEIHRAIFCAGCYAGKRGSFSAEQRDWLLQNLSAGEAEVLYPNAPNQSVLNYMAMRLAQREGKSFSIYNLALHLPPEQVTGNSVTSSHFVERDGRVYDRGNPLTYLHYIGLSADGFNQLCSGKNVDFPYRETFLHYRFLHEPEKRPLLRGRKVLPGNGVVRRMLKKLRLVS